MRHRGARLGHRGVPHQHLRPSDGKTTRVKTAVDFQRVGDATAARREGLDAPASTPRPRCTRAARRWPTTRRRSTTLAHQPARPVRPRHACGQRSPPAAAPTRPSTRPASRPTPTSTTCKVLDANGVGQLSDVLAAIDWVIYHAKEYNIRVMNLSLAADSTETWLTDPLCRAVRSAAAAGITVVVAAGNFGQNASGAERFGTISSPGNDPSVITVGSANTKGTAARSDDTDQPVQLARPDARLVHRRRRRAPHRQPAQARPGGPGNKVVGARGHRQGRRRRLVELPGQDLRRAVQRPTAAAARTARSR